MVKLYAILPLIFSMFDYAFRKLDIQFIVFGTYVQRIHYVNMSIVFWSFFYGLIVFFGVYLFKRQLGFKGEVTLKKIILTGAITLIALKIILQLICINCDYAIYQNFTCNEVIQGVIFLLYLSLMTILVFRWFFIYRL